MWHFVTEPVISYDKCTDVMGLNENDLICIFMNINEIVKEKQGEKCSHCKVLDGL